MDDIIRAVGEALPTYNKYLLIDYPEQQVSSMRGFIEDTFKEAIRRFDGMVIYRGCRTLSPKERVLYEVSGPRRSGAKISKSELELFAFDFEMDGIIHTTHQYVPYLKENQLIIRDTQYGFMYAITEKVFSRIDNGIMVRVIQKPLPFWRSRHFTLKSLTSKLLYNEFIVDTQIHAKKPRKGISTTVVHYLLCKFGFPGVLQRFGMDMDDMHFSKTIDPLDMKDYEYFYAKYIKVPEKRDEDKNPIYLKVKRHIFDDPTRRKFVANILYITSKWEHLDVDELHSPSTSDWLVMLGEILYPSVAKLIAENHAITHIESIDLFLDSIVKSRLEAFGVRVESIYDLLQYIFCEIDNLLVSMIHQNLYDKRLAIVDDFLIKSFVTTIFKRAYVSSQKLDRFKSDSLKKYCNIPAYDSVRNLGGIANISMIGTSIINANMLLSFSTRKIRMNGALRNPSPNLKARDARFHGSIPVVETMVGFSGKSPGITGTINPFLTISEDGSIIIPDYAEDINKISEYLPY
jgi:hypothetical protein